MFSFVANTTRQPIEKRSKRLSPNFRDSESQTMSLNYKRGKIVSLTEWTVSSMVCIYCRRLNCITAIKSAAYYIEQIILRAMSS